MTNFMFYDILYKVKELNMNIILASNSPRRTQILTLAKIYHQVVPSACEETIDQNLEPYEVVESLSYQKAADVAKNILMILSLVLIQS